MINSITVSGHVGKTAETQFLPSGTSITKFSLPATSGYGDKVKTAWLECVMFGKFGEAFAKSIEKGVAVTVQGEFYMEEWEKNGSKMSKNCILVRQIQVSKTGKDSYKAEKPLPKANPVIDYVDDIPF